MKPISEWTAGPEDRQFAEDFSTGRIEPGAFGHRQHLRLAFVLLCDLSPPEAHDAMRDRLRIFLHRNGVDPLKYHETITRAWILAVAHWMRDSRPTGGFEAFIDAHPQLLDGDIMLSHYSSDRLFSDEARERFLTPDRDPIPR